MAYTTTTTTSYGSRVKNSCGGIFGGIALFLAGTALLWWNEGNAVANAKLLEEVSETAVDMENINKINPEFDGQLVHATGDAKTDDMLKDPTFGFEVNAINLQRSVQYYQWVEHQKQEKRDKLGGSEETITTYTYDKQWVSSPVNSSNFADPQYANIFNGVLADFNGASRRVPVSSSSEEHRHAMNRVAFIGAKLNIHYGVGEIDEQGIRMAFAVDTGQRIDEFQCLLRGEGA
jgi:hypothetical protein